jgi:hypothetical protein
MENSNLQALMKSIAISCRRGESCVEPPDDAQLYAVIRIQNDVATECVLRPDATWRHPCYYRGGTQVSCDLFRDVIEQFLQKYRGYSVGAVLYSVYCREFGLRWYAIFDSLWDGYCGDVAIVDVLDDDCIFLL